MGAGFLAKKWTVHQQPPDDCKADEPISDSAPSDSTEEVVCNYDVF